MRYPTQKIAFTYFAGAMALFLAQVLFGVLAGLVYVWPNFLSELLPFNIIRMIHINALIVWLLLGFFGATYYLAARGGGARHRQPGARLRSVLDLLRGGSRGGDRLPVSDP